MTRTRRIAAIDLGTTKVCCAVADVDGEEVHVLGVGQCAARGVRKGTIVEIERAAESVAEAIDAAERMSGTTIDSALVGVAGGHISSQNSSGVVAVSSGNREVRNSDVARAVEAARAVSVPNDRRILHVLPRHFVVDGQEGVRDAIGMSGSRLEVETHIITGANTAIQNVVKVMHEAGLDVDDLVLQVLASAESVITEDEMERGVVVVDIGGGTTDVAVFAHGSILHTGVIPVGGNHVTSDLAVGLRCDLDAAEEVKRLFGHCLQLSIPADEKVTLTPIGYEDPIVVPQRYLAEIIGPRAREIAQLVLAEIEKTGPSALYSAGIVLTGGSSQLRGFTEVIQQVTDLPARVAGPTGLSGMDTEMRGPAYSTAVGLLRWGGRLHSGGHVQLMGRRQRPKNNNGSGTTSWQVNAATNFTRWLRELF